MYLQQSLYHPVEFPESYSLNRFIGWDETASNIEEVCDQNGLITIDYVISSEFELSSALGLYIKDQPKPYSLVDSERNIWSPMQTVKSSRTILICRFEECRDVTLAASAHFESSFELLGDAIVQRAGKVVRELKVFKLVPNNLDS